MEKIILTTIFLIVLLPNISAYPKLTPFVNDYSNILTDSQELYFNNILGNIEKNTSVEISLLTVENTNGEDRVMFASKTGEENGVGKKDFSNGLVVLYSKDNEKGLAIATGRGIESTLNDAKIGRILRENSPLCEDGKYYECFNGIIINLSEETNNIPVSTTSNNHNLIIIFMVLTLIIIFFIIITKGNMVSLLIPFIGRGSKSFNGGSFGGGGAKS